MSYSLRLAISLTLLLALAGYWKSSQKVVYFNDPSMSSAELIKGDLFRDPWPILIDGPRANVVVIGIGAAEDSLDEYEKNLRSLIGRAELQGKTVQLDTTLIPDSTARLMREIAAEKRLQLK